MASMESYVQAAKELGARVLVTDVVDVVGIAYLTEQMVDLATPCGCIGMRICGNYEHRNIGLCIMH